MTEHSTNEYLRSTRAQEDDQDLFSVIGKQVLGLKGGQQEGAVPDDDRVRIVDEIESLCMNCHENGVTRLLLTKIPFFREVILMSFYCEHCNFANNEIKPATEIQEHGVKYVFKITQEEDLHRQLIKSESAIVRIDEIDLEIPAGRGQLSNFEGMLSEVLVGLEAGQKQRQKDDPENYEKIDHIVQKLIKYSNGGNLPFTFTVDDPSGNSSIEPSPSDAAVAGKFTRKQYPRTPSQNDDLGFGVESGEVEGTQEIVPQIGEDTGEGMENVDILEGHPYTFPVECPGCAKPAKVVLQMVNIPHFQQVVISATHCDHCNYHESNVKTGGVVPKKGRIISLKVKSPEDLSRDVLKSETCVLKIPEIHIQVEPGTMGGRFTTVEGLLVQIRDDLRSTVFGDDKDDGVSDSVPQEKQSSWNDIFTGLDKAMKSEINFTIVMQDPLASSYCQEFDEPGKDAQVHSEDYERSEEENEDLGLKDMKTHLTGNGEYVQEPSNQGTEAGVAAEGEEEL